ncbi:MAG: CbtA family protein, partial [Acidimicrobiia bacterium]
MDDIKAFLWRGAAAGAVAGALAAIFQWAVTEREIRAALAIEAAANPGGDEMFSRTTQVIGGMVAAGIYGLLLGIVFAFALAVCAPLLRGDTWFARAIMLASLLFVGWVLIPQLKYPANPPAVGDPDTIGERTASYAALVVIGLIVVFGVAALWRWATDRGILDDAIRFALAVGAGGIVVGLAYVLLPANPDENAVSANLIWRFRVASLVGNAIIWFGIAIVFGVLARQRRSVDVESSRP